MISSRSHLFEIGLSVGMIYKLDRLEPKTSVALECVRADNSSTIGKWVVKEDGSDLGRCEAGTSTGLF